MASPISRVPTRVQPSLIISAVLTALYTFTVAGPMYFSPLGGDVPAGGAKCDPSWMMKLPLVLLCAAIVVLGVYSQPLIAYLRDIASGLIN